MPVDVGFEFQNLLPFPLVFLSSSLSPACGSHLNSQPSFQQHAWLPVTMLADVIVIDSPSETVRPSIYFFYKMF